MPLIETIARDGYTEAEITEALKSEDVTLDFRFELLDSTNTVVRELTTVERASISQDSERDVPRIARFVIQESLGFTERFEFNHSAEWLSYADTAATWDWQTSDAQLVATGGSQSVLIRDELTYADCELEVTTTHQHDGGLVARFQNNSNYYLLAIRDDSGSSASANLQLYKRVNGTLTSITSVDLTFIRDTEHTVRLKVEGNRFRAFFDGVLKLDVTDSAISAAGGVGVRSNGSTQKFKRFSCTSLDTIDFLSHRIKPYVRLLMNADTEDYIEFAQGVFVPVTATPSTDENGIVSYEIEAMDLTQRLIDSTVDDRYFIAANAVVTTEVMGVLSAAGLSEYSVTSSTAQLPQSRDWEPGTPRFEIVKELLTSINYRWGFDGEGKFYAEPWVDPVTRPAHFSYTTDKTSVINPKAAKTLDLYRVPNKVILVMSEPDRTTPLTSTAINNNPGSPTSYQNRGYFITEVIQNVQAPDQATLDDMAARLLFELSQVEETVDLETAIMPFHGHSDTVAVEIDPLRVNDLYELVSWEYELDVNAAMKCRVRRIIQVL